MNASLIYLCDILQKSRKSKMLEKSFYNGCHLSCRFGCHFRPVKAIPKFSNRLMQKLTQRLTQEG